MKLYAACRTPILNMRLDPLTWFCHDNNKFGPATAWSTLSALSTLSVRLCVIRALFTCFALSHAPSQKPRLRAKHPMRVVSRHRCMHFFETLVSSVWLRPLVLRLPLSGRLPNYVAPDRAGDPLGSRPRHQTTRPVGNRSSLGGASTPAQVYSKDAGPLRSLSTRLCGRARRFSVVAHRMTLACEACRSARRSGAIQRALL